MSGKPLFGRREVATATGKRVLAVCVDATDPERFGVCWCDEGAAAEMRRDTFGGRHGGIFDRYIREYGR